MSLRLNTPIFSEFSVTDLHLVRFNTRPVSLRQYASTPDQCLFAKTRQYSLNYLRQIFILYASTPDQCLFAKTRQYSLNFLRQIFILYASTPDQCLFAPKHTNILGIFCDRSSTCTLQHQTCVLSPKDANILELSVTEHAQDHPLVRFNISRPVSLRQYSLNFL